MWFLHADSTLVSFESLKDNDLSFKASDEETNTKDDESDFPDPHDFVSIHFSQSFIRIVYILYILLSLICNFVSLMQTQCCYKDTF